MERSVPTLYPLLTVHWEDAHCEERQVLYPCGKYSQLGKDRLYAKAIHTAIEVGSTAEGKMFRNTVNGKLFRIYMWNKDNSDTRLEQQNDEELLGGSVVA